MAENEIMEEDPRSNLNIQQFMDDMRMLGEQVNSKDIAKPNFNYGDGAVTNYLLWTMLGELMILNDRVEDEE